MSGHSELQAAVTSSSTQISPHSITMAQDTTTESKPPDTNSSTVRNDQSSNSKGIGWIEATRHSVATESRIQPWKQTFGNTIDPRKGVKDLIVMRADDEVQHSGEAGT